MKIMFYIRCYPNKTIMVRAYCDANAMSNDAKRNYIYKQLHHKYRPSHLTFPPANFCIVYLRFVNL